MQMNMCDIYPSFPSRNNEGMFTYLSVSSWIMSIIWPSFCSSLSVMTTARAPLSSARRAFVRNEQPLDW